MKFFSLSLLIFLNDSVHVPSNDLLDYVCFDFSYHTIRLHHNVIFVSGLSFVLEQKLFSVDLRPHSDRIDILVLFQSPFNHYYDFLVVYVLRIFFNYYITRLVAVDFHEV